MTLATISRNRFTDTRIRHSPGIRFIPPNPHTRANTAAVRISSVVSNLLTRAVYTSFFFVFIRFMARYTTMITSSTRYSKISRARYGNTQVTMPSAKPLQPELLLQPVKVFFILIAVLLEHMHIIPHGIKICRDSKHDRYQHTYDHCKYASIIPRNCAGFSRKEK